MSQIVFICIYYDLGCNSEFTIETLHNLLFLIQKGKRNPMNNNLTV